SYREFIEEQSTHYRAEHPADFTARDTMPYYWAKYTSRLAEERALNFSYPFLGVRPGRAQCPKHPFHRLTRDAFKGFTPFFARGGYGLAADAKKPYQELIAKLGDQGNQNQRENARLQRARKGEVVPWKEVFVAPPGTRIEKYKLVPATARVEPRVL